MAAARKIGIVCLVTHVCLTDAILTAKVSSEPTSMPRPWRSYLPAAGSTFPKQPRYEVHEEAQEIRAQAPTRRPAASLERPGGVRHASPFNHHKQKSRAERQRLPMEIQRDGVWLSAEVSSNVSPSPAMATTTTTTTTTTTAAAAALSRPRGIREYHRYVPQLLPYQDIGLFDDHLTDDSADGKTAYRGKAESTYHPRGPQDITATIKALDHFLSNTLNGDSYNSPLHPPPNPILALILSRYGSYVHGTRNPHVYAYMAVNNIHNHQPFGGYKCEFDEQPIYVTR